MVDRGLFWDREIETLPIKQLEALQLKRLRQLLERVWQTNPLFRDHLQKSGFHPDRLKSLKDLSLIPLLGKESILDHPPALLQQKLPWEELRGIYAATSPTLEMIPVTVTNQDLESWAERNARSLWMVGIRPADVILNSFRFGLSTGGFGFHEGVKKLGACNLAIGPGQTDLKVALLSAFPVTTTVMTPSYGIFLAERAKQLGVDLPSSSLRIGLFGAEPYTMEIREELENRMGIKAYDEYGLNELLGPGVACECPVREGLHVWSDHFLVECVDPETLDPVEEGQEGELVWTWLTSEGMAIIRYRSHDLATLTREPCSCGRTHPRIGWITGRNDDALSVGGYIIYPHRIDLLLFRFPQISRFHIIVTTRLELDRMVLEVETPFAPGTGKAKDLSVSITSLLRSHLGLTPEVIMVGPGDLATQPSRYAVTDLRGRTGRYQRR